MSINQGGSPIAGVLTNETKLSNLTNHLDLPTLWAMAAPSNGTDFGNLDIFALTKRADLPFMVASLQNKAITPVEGNTFTYSLPTAVDNSTYIVEDVSGSDRPGYGGQPFNILVSNGKLGGYGSQLMFDITSPYVLEVIEFQRKGEHVLYTVKFTGNYRDDEFVPKQLLQAGSRLFKISATRSAEFGQKYDSWSVDSGTQRKYLNFLTTAQVQTHYHMTDQACNFADNQLVKNVDWVRENLDKVVEYVGITTPIETGVKTVKEFMASGGDLSRKGIIGFNNIVMKYDEISMNILAKEAMNQMVWHPGTITGNDGFDKQVIAPGFWHQMDFSGYKHFFNVDTFTDRLILAAIRDFNTGKVMDTPYGAERTYKIRTGRGGRQLLNKAFEKYLLGANGIVNARDMGYIKGQAKTGFDVIAGTYVNTITVPGEAILVIDEDPSLDPMNANDLVNPMIRGYRLSSYAMIIEDYNDSASNVKILRNKYGNTGRIRMEVISGDRTHPLYEQGYKGMTVHQGSSLATGFGAYFRMTPDTVWVVDPTRILKLVPKNPIPGYGSL